MGLFGRDADITGQRQLVARSQGVAVDGGNGGFFKTDDLAGGFLQFVQIIPVGADRIGLDYAFIEA